MFTGDLPDFPLQMGRSIYPKGFLIPLSPHTPNRIGGEKSLCKGVYPPHRQGSQDFQNN